VFSGGSARGFAPATTSFSHTFLQRLEIQSVLEVLRQCRTGDPEPAPKRLLRRLFVKLKVLYQIMLMTLHFQAKQANTPPSSTEGCPLASPRSAASKGSVPVRLQPAGETSEGFWSFDAHLVFCIKISWR
jgi:hypothetical protein